MPVSITERLSAPKKFLTIIGSVKSPTLYVWNMDIDTALAQSTNFKAFEIRLKDMEYVIQRDENFAHYSVKAPSWQRAVRLDRLGIEEIRENPQDFKFVA